MLVDVGTNTEVVVGNAKRMVAASCPAGPAFEGSGIEYGMPAYPGAIESVKWNDGQISYETIGGETIRGGDHHRDLCGSGLISLLAELRRNNQMSPKGVFCRQKATRLMSLLPEHGITSLTCGRKQFGTSKSGKLLWTIYCSTAFRLRYQRTLRNSFLGGWFCQLC